MNQNLKKLLIKDDNKSSGFNIDYEPVPKKRNYSYIKDNMSKKIYDADNNSPKLKPSLKLK